MVVAAPGASVSVGLSTATEAPATCVLGTTATDTVAVLVPLLVTVRVLLIGSDPVRIYPNEIVAGSTTSVDATAAPASSLPAPSHCTSTGVPWSSVFTSCAAEFTSADLICAAL